MAGNRADQAGKTPGENERRQVWVFVREKFHAPADGSDSRRFSANCFPAEIARAVRREMPNFDVQICPFFRSLSTCSYYFISGRGAGGCERVVDTSGRRA
jgi:hypothetical protein